MQVLGERAWRSLEEEQKVATTNGKVIWEEGKAHRRPILISVALSAWPPRARSVMRASSTQSIRKIPTSRCKTVFEYSGFLSGFFLLGFLLLLGNFSLVFCSVCMCVCEVSFFSPFFSMLELLFVLSSLNRWGYVVCCLWGGFWSCGYFMYERVLLALCQGLLLLSSLSCTFFVFLSCCVCSVWQKR